MAQWALIAGPKSSDRTDQALKLAEELKGAGIPVGGFVQVKRVDEDHKKHFDLLALRSGKSVPLAEEAVQTSPDDLVTFCSLRFDESAFDRARQWLEQDAAEARVLFIGDISKVEVNGRGNYRAAHSALALPDGKLAVICVRADQLFYIVEKFGLEDNAAAILELPADTSTCESFYRQVVFEVTRDKTGPHAV